MASHCESDTRDAQTRVLCLHCFLISFWLQNIYCFQLKQAGKKTMRHIGIVALYSTGRNNIWYILIFSLSLQLKSWDPSLPPSASSFLPSSLPSLFPLLIQKQNCHLKQNKNTLLWSQIWVTMSQKQVTQIPLFQCEEVSWNFCSNRV